MYAISVRVACQRAVYKGWFSQKALQSTQAAKVNIAADSDEYWDEPKYPPIRDLSLKARKVQKRETLYDKIKDIPTVEEKQIALNMPRYYGFKCVRFFEDKVFFGALPLVQHYTRTHLVEKPGLPDLYAEVEPAAALLAKEIKGLIEEAIIMEFQAVKRTTEYSEDLKKTVAHQDEDARARTLTQQINRVITNSLAERLPHMLSAQVDFDPRHEAYWVVGGVNPPRSVRNFHKSKSWLRSTQNDPVDRSVQYSGSPLLTLRSNQPLRPLIPYSEAGNPELKVPKYKYIPETAGYPGTYMHGSNIPGYWTGDQDDFGLLSIHGRGHLHSRKSWFGEKDNLEALDCQAMKASFGWLLAQASYQGFTTYNDITYPLVTQTAITDGQTWSLYAYQLNTIKMYAEHINTNPKRNICYGTGPLKLFEGFDDKGNIVGFNDDVLKQIIQLYMNAPEARDYDMKPYLGAEEQFIADIENDQKRNWLERIYKNLVSNRPRHRLLPEIYLWEKIYKIKFQTRFQEPRRHFFELGKKSMQRRLDEHTPTYIPKVLRPFPKSKKKWEITFYPKV